MTLTRSKDRKTANAVSPNGKTATIANAFGLPSGAAYSCPGATKFCEEICYAGKIETVYKSVSALLIRNYDQLKNATRGEMVDLLAEMVAAFVRDCDKRGAEKLFRIHWDGDFFSPVYVTAWHAVIAANPEVQFWAYTRVPTAATYLHAQKLSNLALYFSGDRDNVAVARHLGARGIRVAYVGRTFDDAKTALPGAVRCPENNGALPLISAKGSACARCGLCVHGRKDVLFSATKK
jgi:ferredoxin